MGCPERDEATWLFSIGPNPPQCRASPRWACAGVAADRGDHPEIRVFAAEAARQHRRAAKHVGTYTGTDPTRLWYRTAARDRRTPPGTSRGPRLRDRSGGGLRPCNREGRCTGFLAWDSDRREQKARRDVPRIGDAAAGTCGSKPAWRRIMTADKDIRCQRTSKAAGFSRIAAVRGPACVAVARDQRRQALRSGHGCAHRDCAPARAGISEGRQCKDASRRFAGVASVHE